MVYSLNKKIIFVVWLLLVIGWNYKFPNAIPFDDVFVAVTLAVLVKHLEKVYG